MNAHVFDCATRDLAARAGPEGLAKTSKTALQLHKKRPQFRVQAWAGYTFCYLAGGLSEPTTVKKMDRCNLLEWEKIQGGIPLHKIYILETQEKNESRNTNSFFLSHGKLRGN